MEDKGCICELIDLKDAVDIDVEDAHVLVMRDALKYLNIDKDKALSEQQSLTYDTKSLMRSVVKNKLARYNICFADFKQEPDYSKGKGRVVDFNEVPYIQQIRQVLQILLVTKLAISKQKGIIIIT